MKKSPLVLVILDGWGYRESSEHNAIVKADTPMWDQLWEKNPHILIEGSGQAVGLPRGQMGNSEVGHMNLGMGRVILQDLTRINDAISSREFFNNPVLGAVCEDVNKKHAALHIVGLLSGGGVHSHESHILAMIQLALSKGVSTIYLHAFLDGRDTPPKSALQSLEKVQAIATQYPQFKIASLVGRYYAMDRDNRWDRIQTAYDLLTEGVAFRESDNPGKALSMAYALGETDEFVKPTAIHSPEEAPFVIKDNDSVIFMNFRADRARALTKAFIEKDFQAFTRSKTVHLANFVTLTQYDKTFEASVAFLPPSMEHGLGEFLSQHGYTQLRIAETEKYAHVTFFFNGGIESPFPLEERILIPSLKIPTYDLHPEMRANEITDVLVEKITQSAVDVIICNFANPDMVGHTGDFKATIKAIEIIDSCLARIITAIRRVGGQLLITADHGNAECMFDSATGQAHTAHTSDPVPLIYEGRKAEFINNTGVLADIAPTMLYLLGLTPPIEMTGHNLLRYAE